MQLNSTLSRRCLLTGTTGLVAGAGCTRAERVLERPLGGSRVVVVGAGLAGLTCTDMLHRHGVAVVVHEARADRIGGRCWTSRGWRDGQVAEHGGECIDTRHDRIRHLVRRFGLGLEDLYATDDGGSRRLWLDGELRRVGVGGDSLAVFTRRIRRLARQIGPYTWPDATRMARAIDEMTAREMVDTYLPGGSRSLAGQRYAGFLASFLGLDLDRLSGLATVDNVDLPPDADERYYIRGGNDQLVTGLADALPTGTIVTDSALLALRRRRDGSYAMRFSGTAREVVADQVVLCLPFTALRRVDLDGSGLGPHKRRCIDELGMGTNAKVLLQLRRRPQHYGNWNGALRTDAPGFDTWESSVGQPGRASLLTIYPGGRSGGAGLVPDDIERRAHGPAPSRLVAQLLRALDRNGRMLLPRVGAGYLGRAHLDHWSVDPWTRGSYAAFLPGQYTRFAGFVGRPEGRLHFAGEHTAPLADQGYLEGAVRTGERAAREVLRSLSRPAASLPAAPGTTAP